MAVAVLAAAGLWLAYQRWGRSFDWREFGRSFLQYDRAWLAASIGLALLTYLGRALRWGVLMRPVQARPRLWNLLSATVIGFAATTLLGRPGEFVRPYLISAKESVPFSSQMAAWILERILDLLAVLVVFGFALTQVQESRASVGPALQWALSTGGYIVGIASAACLVVLFLFRQYSERMCRRLLDALAFLPPHHHARMERTIRAFAGGLAATRGRASVALLLLYTVAEWLIIVLCYQALFRACPATSDFSARDVLIFLGFVAFGSVVQIPGIGGGIQVVSIIVLTELFGLPVELATSLAILGWIVTWVIVVPPGILLALHEGFTWGRLRQLAHEQPGAGEV